MTEAYANQNSSFTAMCSESSFARFSAILLNVLGTVIIAALIFVSLGLLRVSVLVRVILAVVVLLAVLQIIIQKISYPEKGKPKA